MSGRNSPRRRPLEPLLGLAVVLRNARPIHIHAPDKGLRERISHACLFLDDRSTLGKFSVELLIFLRGYCLAGALNGPCKGLAQFFVG